MSKAGTSQETWLARKLAGWTQTKSSFVRSCVRPGSGTSHSVGKPALRRFRECLNELEFNILLFGNGLVLQFGHGVSTREICYRMAKRNWRHWPLFVRSLLGVHEFERLMAGKPARRQQDIKYDFALALIEITGEMDLHLEEAAAFLNEFDEAFTLNYDIFTARLRECPIGSTGPSLKRTVWDELQLRLDRPSPSPPASILDGDESDRGTAHGGNATHTSPTVPICNHGNHVSRWVDGFMLLASRYEWSDVAGQNFSNIHGSFDFFVIAGKAALYRYGKLTDLTRDAYLTYLEEQGAEMLFILAPHSATKVEIMNQHDYFKACLKKLKDIEGNLYIYGIDFRKLTDEHIWKTIRENANIANIYIAVSPDDQTYRDDIKLLLPDCDKVHFFDWNIR